MQHLTIATSSGIVRLMLVCHFGAALIALMAGTVALSVTKGGRLHKRSGLVHVGDDRNRRSRRRDLGVRRQIGRRCLAAARPRFVGIGGRCSPIGAHMRLVTAPSYDTE